MLKITGLTTMMMIIYLFTNSLFRKGFIQDFELWEIPADPSLTPAINLPVVNDLAWLLLYAASCSGLASCFQRGQKDTRWVYRLTREFRFNQNGL